jgi:hypothetical protein
MAELVHERTYYTPYVGNLPAYVVGVIFNILQFLLAVRLVLVFFGASTSSSFVAWFYDFTGRLIAPFSGAFPSLSIAGFALELSTIFAMLGYMLIGWVIVRLLSAFE